MRHGPESTEVHLLYADLVYISTMQTLKLNCTYVHMSENVLQGLYYHCKKNAKVEVVAA